AIEYVQGFSTKEPKSLILQGSYGTGKSHLAYAIAKAVKSKGHTVAFMHIPMLMDRIKATYNKNAVETTDELVRLLSDIGSTNGLYETYVHRVCKDLLRL
ncbi:hypothetical protein O784_00324, partial [Staphylococcus aureus M0222]